MTREQELNLFRNLNGNCKKWESGGRYSFTDSNREVNLRQNQGKAKSKLIKFILKNNIKEEFWLERW